MTILSVTDQTYLNYAAHEAKKSKLLSRHGCVAVANGKIIGRGHNSSRTQSYDGFICNTCSCHAEIAALRDLYHTCCTNTYGKYGKQIKVVRQPKNI
jgi:tRNA(Arg) A34 adenosine deaminase TadA